MNDQTTLITRVQLLVEAMENSDIGELELTEGGTRIQIKLASAVTPTVLSAPAMPFPAFAPGMLAGSMPTGGANHAPAASAPAKRATRPPAAESGVAVTSPLMGVYYGAASPDSDPFVKVGDGVQVGQVVAIVEAMKVFNEVKSEVAGKVIAIPARNNELVQKGDALVRIQPD
ncbi:MAG TPA: acetyl-CoA carboxylase biotin carboxyl carrier protein [Ktedonobacterales bacterium]|jgi:acetyl-CoA carboxylase biotin carboxyl carrier protein